MTTDLDTAHKPALNDVTAAARRAADAMYQLHKAIRHARTQGATLRETAQAAGLSHEQIRRIANQ